MECAFICNDDNKCQRTSEPEGIYCWQHDTLLDDIIATLKPLRAKKMRRNPEAPTEKERAGMIEQFRALGESVGWTSRYHEKYDGIEWGNPKSIEAAIKNNLLYHEEPAAFQWHLKINTLKSTLC